VKGEDFHEDNELQKDKRLKKWINDIEKLFANGPWCPLA
jgi:hypothetical protein